jgi:hypothetical protein
VTGAYDWLNSSAEAFLAQHLPAAAQRAGAQRATQVTNNWARPTLDPPKRPWRPPSPRYTNHPSTTQERRGRD